MIKKLKPRNVPILYPFFKNILDKNVSEIYIGLFERPTVVEGVTKIIENSHMTKCCSWLVGW